MPGETDVIFRLDGVKGLVLLEKAIFKQEGLKYSWYKYLMRILLPTQ